MTALARRGILKIIGAVPFAGATAASELAPLLASPAVAAAAALTAQSAGQTLPAQFGTLGPLLGKQLKRMKRQMENEMWARRQGRQAGLDGDIACLRSTSRVYKERQQYERDCEEDSILRHADFVMWGE